MLVIMVGGADPLVHSNTCRGLLVPDDGWATMAFTFGHVSSVRPSFPPSCTRLRGF
jgi:hypothetical protein